MAVTAMGLLGVTEEEVTLRGLVMLDIGQRIAVSGNTKIGVFESDTDPTQGIHQNWKI